MGTHSGRRLAAVVFTDVVGYSARMQRDETGTMALVAADFTRMRESGEQLGGEVLNSMGDGLLLCFASAVQAVAWALQIQSEFGRRRASRPPEEALEHRMGIHIGDVFRQEAGGVAGDGVNIAARLEGKAPAGGICVSQMVYDTVKGKVPMQAVFIGPEAFKNIAEPIPIWHIAAEDSLAPARPSLQGRTPRIPDYELLRRIGQGGYGEVWLARGLTGIFRAVKIVWRERFENAEPFEREFRGVKESMSISHEPGQLALHHVGQDERAGFFYYVMELADDTTGGRAIEPARYVPMTLKELKARRGRLPAGEGVALGAEIARALAALHARGLVHRDIKPSNIVLVNGTPKLADVGLVAASSDARTMVGTQGYLPPEGPGAPAADVFALGKVLYELATGLDRDEFPRLPEHPGDAAERRAFFGLNQIILRACEPRAGQRYQDAGAMLADLVALQTGRALRQTRKRRLAMTGGGLLLAALLFVGGTAILRRPAHRISPPAEGAGVSVPAAVGEVGPAAVSPQSIAVMPFESFSDDKGNGYLADGLQEDVLTDLAGISDLKVAPRASVLRYRGTTKAVKQIGLELGVAYLLNGSVRREANRIRVTAELVDARTERQVWAKKYDREVNDVLSLQSALADEIVPALQVALSPAEKMALTKAPTSSESAYTLFLQAKSLRLNGDTGDGSALRRAEELLRQAVAADPGFVRAWVELSAVYTDRYRQPDDRTAARIAQAQEAIETARRLAPDSPEVLLGLERIRRYCFRDLAGAMIYVRQVLAKYPHYPEAHLRLGVLDRRLGRWSEALAELREAWRQEPGDLRTGQTLGLTLEYLHRFDEAQALATKLRALAPGDVELGYEAALWEFRRHGTREPFDRWLAGVPAAERTTPQLVDLQFGWAMSTGDAAMVRDLIGRHGITIGHMDAVIALQRAGRRDEALKLLEGLKPELDRRRTANPEMPYNWIWLGAYRALRGEREEALAAMNQARELLPETADAFNSAGLADANAEALVWLGDTDAALAEAERLLKKPGDLHVWYLRSALTWQPLHGNPRFEALLADPANSAPLDLDRLASPGEAAPPTGNAPTAPAPADEKLVAVLPLENLSLDPNDAFFADGVHEELLTDLANLKSLRVISRTSVMQYRGTKKTIGQIAHELGVAYVVEGTVRRAGNRVRVTGQLIKAATDEPVWARSYDRELQDIFAVQSDLAREIAGALDAALSPAETARLTSSPTRNLEAYECLQRARVIARSNADEGDLREKILPLLERAVALDPEYAEAWAELSGQQLTLYEARHAESVLAEAKASLARAEQLAPDAYAVLSAGSDFGAITGDRVMVNARRRRIIELFPNRAESHFMRALDASYALHWADARAEYLAALQLDPRNPGVLESYYFMLDSLRRWDEAEPIAARLVEVQPDNLDARLMAASMAFRRSGSTAALTRLLAELPRTDEGGQSAIVTRTRIAFLTGDWAGIVGLWRETGARFRTGGFEDLTARFMVAGAFLKLGDATSARTLLERNREELTREVQDAPDELGRWNDLGLTLGMLGDRAGAQAALDRAARLIAAGRQEWARRFSARWDNALARCWVGDKSAVIAELGRMLREPVEHPATATVRVLRIHWASIPLQGDPEFEAMLHDPRNNAPLF